MTPAELLASRKHVLLDFDGPVCAVFGTLPDWTVANQLRALLGVSPQNEHGNDNDPFSVLRYAATLGPRTAALVERELCDLELEAVIGAVPTPGARAAMTALAASNHTVTIVSNNSEAAVKKYLAQHQLTDLVTGTCARTFTDPTLLKPNPHLLRHAIKSLGTGPGECIMIGDSVSDVHAGRAAGTATIAYANRPAKRADLQRQEPDIIIEKMESLILFLRNP